MSDLDNYTRLLREQSVLTRHSSPLNLGRTTSEKPKAENLLDTVRFPGWYKDLDGGLCVIYKEHLISIRFDEASTQYHVCADVLGSRGLWG